MLPARAPERTSLTLHLPAGWVTRAGQITGALLRGEPSGQPAHCPVGDCHHCPAEVVRKVNELIATGQYGRLFAVVHFAGHQWKVTTEDLILIENELDIKCGERIRLEKVRCKLFCGRGARHQ